MEGREKQDDDVFSASVDAAMQDAERPKRPRQDRGPVYAVAAGKTRGIFFTWEECKVSVSGYSGAVHEKFDTVDLANAWLDSARCNVRDDRATVVYIDGACKINHGMDKARAGVGVWFGNGDARNVSERLEGAQQTSQRAELMALIRALEKAPDAPLHVFSDSDYCVSSVNFRLNAWIKCSLAGVANADLWCRIHALLSEREHGVCLERVAGHSGNAGNDAADRLAKAGSMKD